MQAQKLEYQPLGDIVFQTIRNQIVWGNLLPGQRLMETQLAEKLGVSRTPVREAIKRLELEGLIVMVPRKGAHVAPFTKKDIKDVLEIRAVLESLAASLAAQRIDQKELTKLQLVIHEYELSSIERNIDVMIQKDVEFHELIFDATKNDRLIQVSQNIREQVLRYRIAYLKYEGEGKIVLAEHRNIFTSIKNRNAKKAGHLAMEHINTQCDAILKFID